MELLSLLNLVGRSSKAVTLDQNKVGRLSRVDALQGQAMTQACVERQKQHLIAIDAAITRIGSSYYGRCSECDQWIPFGRLKINPAIELCVGCAAMYED